MVTPLAISRSSRSCRFAYRSKNIKNPVSKGKKAEEAAKKELNKRFTYLEASKSGRQSSDRILVLSIILSRQRNLLVVIKNDNHILIKESSMVHGLVSHATSDGTITDNLHKI